MPVAPTLPSIPINKNPYLAKVMFPAGDDDLQQRSVQKIDGIPYSNGHAVAIGERDGNSISAAATTRLTASMPTT